MNHLQPNQPQQPSTRLLTAGRRAPLLLTTRIISVAVVIPGAEKQTTTAAASINEVINTADGNSAARYDAATIAAPLLSPQGLPVVKLLGKIKGGMPGEQFVQPGTCPKCQLARSMRVGETECPRCLLSARVSRLTRERKLSGAVWEKIRRTLSLPAKIESLSKEQSRAALHLLNTFVKRFSFDDQETMTADAVRAALRDLPGLSKQFGKAVKGATVAAAASAHTEESGGAAKRKPISAAKFTEVAARQGLFCFWCGVRVIRESEVPQTNRIVKNHSTIVYLSGDGQMREEAFATIDHLVRVTDGGDNRTENLVISCCDCNREREIKTLRYNRPFARRRVPCRSCGGRFFHPDWGCCSICGAPPERPKKHSSLSDFFRQVANFFFKIISDAFRQTLSVTPPNSDK